MGSSVEATGWNRIYDTARKYEGEPPIPFIDTILAELGEEGKAQFGLYIGCGNGRNYIPLLDAGLRLHGMDISEEAIKQLKARRPEAEGKVFSADFGRANSASIFDYLIAIQVFQHGDQEGVNNLYKRAHMALKPGGKLFLRTNSTSTEIHREHEVIERNPQGGFTVRYKSGEKEDMKIHFATKEELARIRRALGFTTIRKLIEVTESRKDPGTGTWAQWEAIWQKI